jgi:hypothetical protein
MQQFGQIVFPRGTYLVGHLEADKEPGHFVGKGYLKLAFDRIGLPSADLPLTAKVIAVAGFNVDRQGKVIGHGHATRDVVEWMLPPLWPWKVLTLPAKGPRPTLKGETRVTLRVMDDIIVPQTTTPGWHRFGETPSSYPVPDSHSATRAVISAAYQPAPANVAPRRVETVTAVDASLVSALPPGLNPDADPIVVYQPAPATGQPAIVQVATVAPVPPVMLQPVIVQPKTAQPRMTAAAVTVRTSSTTALVKAWPANVTLFILADGTVFPATQYWLDHDQLWYICDGDKGTVAISSIDWSTTTKLNVARNVRVTLRNAPADLEPGSN